MAEVKDKVVVTGAFVANFVQIFKAKSYDESREPEYAITMAFKKDDPSLKDLKRAARIAMEERWGTDKTKWPKNYKNPFKDGDDKPEYVGFENTTYIKASNKRRQPELVDRRGQPITKEADFYSGCIARAEVIAFSYDTKTNKGVSFSLQNVQKIRDGEPLSGARRAKDVFGELPLDDDEEDLDLDAEGDEEDEDETPPSAKKKKRPPPPPAADEDDEEDEDEEDAPPPPKKRKGAARDEELW